MPAIRVFINEMPIDVPVGATVSEAVAAADPDLGTQLESGAAHATDGRGIALSVGDAVVAGSIIRVLRSRQRGGEERRAHA